MLKQTYNISLATAALVLISACSQPAEDPKTVADRYWQNLQTGNDIEAEKLVSINSRKAFATHSEAIDSSTQVFNDDARTVVTTTITKIDPKTQQPYTDSFETILVLEQGKWKIDASRSIIPAAPISMHEELETLADDLSESMKENVDSLDQAMEQGLQMLDDAMQEGSKEMSESLQHLMDELNRSMQESIEKMKERREQQLQEQEQKDRLQQPKTEPLTPDPDKGEGMI